MITDDGDSTANCLIIAGEKQKFMRQTLENIQLQSNSILHLALQWKDLEEYFDSVSAVIAKREEEIELKNKQIDWKIKYMKKKSSDIEERKMEVKEMLEMAEERYEEVDEMYEEVREMEKCYDDDLESWRWKFERLREYKRDLRRKFRKRELELECKELWIDNREHEVEFRNKKLNFVERELLERLQEIEEKERRIKLSGKNLDDKSEKMKLKNEGFCEEDDYADIRFNVVMNGKDLQKFLNGRVNDHEKLRDEVTRGISLSLDPPKLVLDAIEGFYPEDFRDGDVGFDLNVVRKSCVLLLEQLNELRARIKARVRERAIRVAMEWKKKMNVDVDECCLEVVGFLQLVATYGLVSEFRNEELLWLLESCAKHDRLPELCRSLGFTDHVHDIIQNLVLRDQPFEAIKLVYAFQLVDIFPPVPILEAHLKSTFHNAQKLYGDEDATMEVQIKCVNMKLGVLDSVVKCIKKYGLESKYSVQDLEHQILKLQVQKMKFNAVASVSKAKITIEDQELCISARSFSSSDKETDSSTCSSPNIPLLSPIHSQEHTRSAVGLGAHHDPAVVDEPLAIDNFESSSLIEYPCLNYSSGSYPGYTPPITLMNSCSALNHEHTSEPECSSLHGQTQSNRGSKRPCLAYVAVAKDLGR